MEKLFHPNRWLLIFCVALAIVFIALQIVSNMVLEEQAGESAREIFTWSWPEKNWTSSAKITGISIVSKTRTDAIVKVTGKQDLLTVVNNTPTTEVLDLSITLSFYQLSNRWILGKVVL